MQQKGPRPKSYEQRQEERKQVSELRYEVASLRRQVEWLSERVPESERFPPANWNPASASGSRPQPPQNLAAKGSGGGREKSGGGGEDKSRGGGEEKGC